MGEFRISVVMACYHGDQLYALKEAVDSVLAQTLEVYEFIVVVDGYVPDDVKNYLTQLEETNESVKLIFLEKNGGAAKARNIGMSEAEGDYLAIMDSDDVLVPERLEEQYSALVEQDVDVVWAWQQEFYDMTGKFAGIKSCPEKHEDIVKSLKWRCLLPDPTTFMKRCCFEKTGGYGEYRDLNIDYHFFLMMELSGCKFYAVQKPLIKVRISPEQRRRRGGISLLKQDVDFRKWMLRNRIINIFEFVLILSIFTVFRLQPNMMRDWVYRYILRK